MTEPSPARERLQQAATRGVITETEMRRRADSVSQAALIVRRNEEASRQRLIKRLGIGGIVLIVTIVGWIMRG